MTPAHQLLSSEAHHQQTKWKVTMDGKNSHVYQESDKKDILTCFRCITVMPFCTRVSIIGQVSSQPMFNHVTTYTGTTSSPTYTQRGGTSFVKGKRRRRT